MAINFSAGLGQGLGIGQAIEQQPLVSGLQVQVVGALGRCGRGGEGRSTQLVCRSPALRVC
jgi:hypothetical protein